MSHNGNFDRCNGRVRQNGFDPDNRPKVEPGPHAGEGYCSMPAGWGTDRDEGRCKRHGGNGGRPVKHGLYSFRREELRTKLRDADTDEHPGDLWTEVAVLRTLLAEFLEDVDEVDSDVIDGAAKLQGEIRKTVDTINKMLTRTAPTDAEINQLVTGFANIIRSYVPESDRSDAIAELQAITGTREPDRLESGHSDG